MIVKNVKQNVGQGVEFCSWLAFTGKLLGVIFFGGLGGIFSCSVVRFVYTVRKKKLLSLTCNILITHTSNHKNKHYKATSNTSKTRVLT